MSGSATKSERRSGRDRLRPLSACRCPKTGRPLPCSAPLTTRRASGRRGRSNWFARSANGPGTPSNGRAPKRRSGNRRRGSGSRWKRPRAAPGHGIPGRMTATGMTPSAPAFGFTPEEVPSFETWFARVHVEDRSALRRQTRRDSPDDGSVGLHIPSRTPRWSRALDAESGTSRSRQHGPRHATHWTRTGHHRAPQDRGRSSGASRRGTRSRAANAARDGDAGHRVGGRARDARLCESGGRGDVRLGRRRADRPTDRAPDPVDRSRRHEPRGRPGPRRYPQGRVHVSDRSHRQSRADVGRRTPFRVRDRHHRAPAHRGGPSGALDRTGIPDDATAPDGVGPDARRAPCARADRQDAARWAPAASGHRGDEPRTAAQAGDRGRRGAERGAGRSESNSSTKRWRSRGR